MPGASTEITLSNGVHMPQLGIGTWEAKEGDETVRTVKLAVREGYRHIDTAHYYKNEVSVGEAIKDCGVAREELFVVTKLWNYDHGYEKAFEAFERSRAALDVEYIDLYLIHWPGPNTESLVKTWQALEELYAQKKVRAIGVSNCEEHHLAAILKQCKVRPMVNQVEMHPLFQQEPLRAFCKEHGIAVTAWRPLGKGALLNSPPLVGLAAKHHRTPAQVILRWLIQVGVITIPKSSNDERIKENFNVFDFELDESDMSLIKSLDENKRLGENPATFFLC